MQSYYDVIDYFSSAIHYIMGKCLKGKKELHGEVDGEKVAAVDCPRDPVGTFGQLGLTDRARGSKARRYGKRHPG